MVGERPKEADAGFRQNDVGWTATGIYVDDESASALFERELLDDELRQSYPWTLGCNGVLEGPVGLFGEVAGFGPQSPRESGVNGSRDAYNRAATKSSIFLSGWRCRKA
jgi:hypothetical protein